MICLICNKEFSQTEKNKHLPNFSPYQNQNTCLDCTINELKQEQTNLYPEIKKAQRQHEKLKKLYFNSSDKVSQLQKHFKDLNYEQSMIEFNIRSEKARKEKKPSKKKPAQSTEEVTAEAISNMLANLTEEERKNVMASYNDMLTK